MGVNFKQLIFSTWRGYIFFSRKAHSKADYVLKIMNIKNFLVRVNETVIVQVREILQSLKPGSHCPP